MRPMHPSAVLLAALTDSRRARVPFDEAWPDALERAVAAASTGRDGWRLAFEATREAWRAAHDREPGPPAERPRLALVRVAHDPERTEAVVAVCAHCAGPLPAQRGGPPRIYCSEACRRREARQTRRVA